MADEILGNCYELITEIALEDYSSVLKKGEQIFAQETPVGIGIIPDIIIGADIQKPRILLQVHHTRAESASQKKFWRNIGEYVDGRNALGGVTRIVTITFDSGQKRKLSAAATHLMDGFLEVDRQAYGKELLAFAKALEAEIAAGKIKEDKRLELGRKRLAKGPATIAAIKAFAADLNVTLSSASKAGASWFATYSKIQTGRSAPRIPKRKLTTLRRALGRFLPVDDEVLLRKLLQSIRMGGKAPWPQYLIDLGIATKTLADGTFTNPCPAGTKVSRKMESDPAYEAFLMTEHFTNDEIVRLWKKLRSITTSMSQACASIRSANEFVLYHKFVVENFAMLATQAGMAKALKDCFDDPGTVLGKTIGLANPAEKGVWLFEYLMTIIKANSGRQQGFGYTRLDDEAGTGLGTGIGPHLSLFVSREKSLRADLLHSFATVLADRLAAITKRWVNLNGQTTTEFALTARFEDGIYKCSKFDPALAIHSSKIKSAIRNTRTSTFLTKFVGKGATTCDTLIIGDTLIMWQSASAQGDDHKTKELCGRIGMLRVTTNKIGKVVPAPFKKAILVIDGTWKEDQLTRLASAGFDGIYYVDEIDELLKELNKKP
jgi:hypothetical protein